MNGVTNNIYRDCPIVQSLYSDTHCSECASYTTDQDSANYSSRAKSILLPFFANEVLHSHTHLLSYGLWLLSSYMEAELYNCSKILWSPKNKYLLSGTLLEKNVLLLDIDIAFDTLISNRQTNKKLNRDLTFLSFFPTSFLSSFLFWSEIERPYLVKSSISFCFSD